MHLADCQMGFHTLIDGIADSFRGEPVDYSLLLKLDDHTRVGAGGCLGSVCWRGFCYFVL